MLSRFALPLPPPLPAAASRSLKDTADRAAGAFAARMNVTKKQWRRVYGEARVGTCLTKKFTPSQV